VEKSSLIKKRLLEVAKNKGISYENFFKDFGTTYANFKGKSLKSSLRSDVLVDFSSKHPDVDLGWLITGKEVKKTEKEVIALNEPQESYGKNYKDLYIEVLEENRQLHKELITELKKRKG
jgi:hypothetical protein